MAADLPNSRFVGIDLSARQIEEGRATISEHGLVNIELLHKSISDVGPDMGKFDYILCYGVYSWVPEDVQKKILDIGRQNLADNGIMYVSYNTYPGWHLRGIVRDAMAYHVCKTDPPKQQILQARAMLNLLENNARSSSKAYPQFLKDEAKNLKEKLDCYIYHEYLEEFNQPLYFHEFVERADQAGLRFLANSDIRAMVADHLNRPGPELLKGMPLVRREQYKDFLEFRTFRSSLLCHRDIDSVFALSSSNFALSSGNVESLHASLVERLQPEPLPTGEVKWNLAQGAMTTQAPLTGMIEQLHRQFPGWISVQDLLKDVYDDSTRASLLDAILSAIVPGIIRVSLEPIEFSQQVSAMPECTRFCRRQAKAGNRITSRFHEDWELVPQQSYLLEHLDGSRSVDDLALMFYNAIQNGRFPVSGEDPEFAFDLNDAKIFVRDELERFRLLGVLL